jgi:hypothetical protein
MKAVRYVEFSGSFFWLVFWVVVLLPVAVLYFVLKSCVVEQQVEDEALRPSCAGATSGLGTLGAGLNPSRQEQGNDPGPLTFR